MNENLTDFKDRFQINTGTIALLAGVTKSMKFNPLWRVSFIIWFKTFLGISIALTFPKYDKILFHLLLNSPQILSSRSNFSLHKIWNNSFKLRKNGCRIPRGSKNIAWIFRTFLLDGSKLLKSYMASEKPKQCIIFFIL